MDKCKWKVIVYFDSYYDTECGKSGHGFNNFKYCPYCGKQIEIQESE